MKILVVCTGNICRSPMGEIVLRDVAARAGLAVEVSSAGVSAEETGNPIDRRAAAVLREKGTTCLAIIMLTRLVRLNLRMPI